MTIHRSRWHGQRAWTSPRWAVSLRPARTRRRALRRTSTMTSPAPTRANIYGHRARIGYTSPPLTTEIFPYEFYKIVPTGVTLVITTLAIVVRSKGEVDQSYDISMKAAREMAAAGVDLVVLARVPLNLFESHTHTDQRIIPLHAAQAGD